MILDTDSYKQFHPFFYPKNLTKLVSGFTPRASRIDGVDEAVFTNLQYYIKKYLIKKWNKKFFNKPLEEVLHKYKRFHKYFSGVPNMPTEHVEKLHKLGYLPLEILALPEGARVPLKVPMFIVHNTHKDFAWLTNQIETSISNCIWEPIVVATKAGEYSKLLTKWAIKTGGDPNFVKFQMHDFSMRGKGSHEASKSSQFAHLLFAYGTDTIPAVQFAEKWYGANIETELVGTSVPATEHSIACAYGETSEAEMLIDHMNIPLFKDMIISEVMDTWDLWHVLTNVLYQPKVREIILSRSGKLVIRPDSGNPVDIICGLPDLSDSLADDHLSLWLVHDAGSPAMFKYKGKVYAYDETSYKDFREEFGEHADPDHTDYIHEIEDKVAYKGVIELLWDNFGGTINEKGFKVLDPHIGAIYGDSITLERAEQICQRLHDKGFCTTNIVLGIGSYTYNYHTRDILGIAMKATYAEYETQKLSGISTESRELFKDPITDSGEKKSAKGLCAVFKDDKGKYYLKDQATWEEVYNCEFKPVFRNGELLIDHKLSEIRSRLHENQF